MRPSRLLSLALALIGWAAGARAATEPAAPQVYTGLLSLVRYDMPIGRSDGFAPTRQLAQRKEGEDAIDWPELTLNGGPLFRTGAEEHVALQLRSGAEAASPFQLRTDDVVQPGNHWLRAMNWRGGRRHIYTADRTARTANGNETMSGRYELWTFPLRITGEGGPGVKNVLLKAGAASIYKKDGPWRSLTLLVPASEPGRPYELTVDGRPPIRFEIGFMPMKLGSPRERLYALDTSVGGEGPKVRVQILERAETFPNPKEWAADLAALRQRGPASWKFERPAGFTRYMGVEVPRSPFTIYATQLPAGQSGGFYKQSPGGFTGSPEEYAAWLAGLGFDAVFDQANALPPAAEAESFEARAAALARHGMKLGLEYDNNGSRPSLQHPTLPLFAHTLPEWHAPLYRSLSLAAQRFGRLPNFLGLCVGANSSGYAADWTPAPPAPDRPWGEAMIEFLGKPQPTVPRAPQAGPPQFPFEYVAKNTSEFIKYVQRHDAAFQQYEYFAEAVRLAAPRLIFTTSCFGSAPGPGARGGWPWASLPGRAIFSGLNVLQAYDFNQTHAALPMHNEALTDRLGSYWEKKPTWSLLDNYQFLYGRETYQRACALALTRGIRGLGTNFLPKPGGDAVQTEAAAYQAEMNAWIHQLGGVYAHLEPDPVIGIFYGQQQGVQRGVVTGESPTGDLLYEGSHEGKVNEALFLCHAAGYPARVITYQEIMRGPLPTTMKAILLVGASQPDASWTWGQGIEKPFQHFVERGGRVLLDEESVAPIEGTKTTLRLAAYQPQSQLDPTPLLLARNATNLQTLRAAMEGVARPLATSSEPTVWAIPGTCGDVAYLTVVNQASAQGDEAGEAVRTLDARATKPEPWKTRANASLYVRPQTGKLTWTTDRPIYDLRQYRRLTAEEAGAVDLRRDSFQFYAIPPQPVTEPKIALAKGSGGFYEAIVTIGDSSPMAGIPIRLRVTRGDETADLFGASGFAMRLPVHERDAGDFLISASELLTGLTAAEKLTVAAPTSPGVTNIQNAVRVREADAVTKFADRKATPLVIALTPEQAQDPQMTAQAMALQGFYQAKKRTVTIARVAPGSVVESLQPLRSPHRYPQWKTVASDLVLFGTPANNVLLLDQSRAEIFPLNYRLPASGTADVLYARSAFVGECDVVNIIAPDLPSLTAAVKTLTAPPPPPPPKR